MPNTQESRVARDLLQLRVHRRRLEIDPADHARNEWMIAREIEKPPRLLQCLPCLDRDGSIDATPRHLALQVRGREIPLQRPHRVVYPVVLDGIVPPEVLV